MTSVAVTVRFRPNRVQEQRLSLSVSSPSACFTIQMEIYSNVRCRVCAHPGPTAIRGGERSQGGLGVHAETVAPATRLRTMPQTKMKKCKGTFIAYTSSQLLPISYKVTRMSLYVERRFNLHILFFFFFWIRKTSLHHYRVPTFASTASRRKTTAETPSSPPPDKETQPGSLSHGSAPRQELRDRM